MSVEDFIASDINLDDEFVNDLYNCALEVESKGSFTKEDCLELFSLLGQLDVAGSAFESLIEFYVGKGNNDGILTRFNIGEGLNNPFNIERKTYFLNKMYEGIDSEEELIFNQIFLANRMSKMPRAMSLVKKGNIKSALGWTAEETKIMKEMYDEYIKYKYRDFLSLEMDDKGQPIGDYDRTEFLKFRQWFQNSLTTLVNNYPNIDKTQISFNNLDEELKRFQMLAKLNKSSDIMYAIKSEGIKRAIELASNRKNGLKVFDATDEKESSKDERLIHIELPGYNAPLRVHIKEDNRKKIGIDLRDITKKVDEYHWQPIWYFRLNEEQLSFAEKLPRNISGVSEAISDCILYLRKSAESVKRMELEDERIEKRKGGKIESMDGTKINVEDIFKETSVIDETDKAEDAEEITSKETDRKAKARIRKQEYDRKFVEEKICAGLEKYFSLTLSDKYKEGLIQNGANTKLEKIYDLIYNFIDREDKPVEEKEKDAIIMFIYMKLCDRSFWTATYKKEIIDTRYPTIYQEMREKKEKIKELIEEDIDIDEFKSIIKGKMIIKDKPTTRTSMKRKNKRKTKQKNNDSEGVIEEIDEPKIEMVNSGLEESKVQVVDIDLGDSKIETVNTDLSDSAIKTVDPNLDDSEFEEIIEGEKSVFHEGQREELESIEKKNEILSSIIIHKDEGIKIQEQLIKAKEDYAFLLQELKERKEIILTNEEKLAELGIKIEELEEEIFGHRRGIDE